MGTIWSQQKMQKVLLLLAACVAVAAAAPIQGTQDEAYGQLEDAEKMATAANDNGAAIEDGLKHFIQAVSDKSAPDGKLAEEFTKLEKVVHSNPLYSDVNDSLREAKAALAEHPSSKGKAAANDLVEAGQKNADVVENLRALGKKVEASIASHAKDANHIDSTASWVQNNLERIKAGGKEIELVISSENKAANRAQKDDPALTKHE